MEKKDQEDKGEDKKGRRRGGGGRKEEGRYGSTIRNLSISSGRFVYEEQIPGKRWTCEKCHYKRFYLMANDAVYSDRIQPTLRRNILYRTELFGFFWTLSIVWYVEALQWSSGWD
jgi:hypothetical protein